jgi:hypothetical protein
MNEPKKRLQIMPEVLPAPTRVRGASDVRGKTVAHMQRLLATAAALPLADCTRTDTQQGTQTVTIPVASASATTSDTVQGSLLPPPSTTPPKPTATPPDMGYAVVDPMPAPARCMGLAAASKATAVFKKDASGLVLEVTLVLPTGGAWPNTSFLAGGTPSAWSGTIVSTRTVGMTSVAKVRVPAGSTSAGVTFPIDCPAGQGNISVNVSFPGISEAAKTSVTTHDY